MVFPSKKPGLRRHSSSRRIIVVVVPPVDKIDLVAPLQVFNSLNRLAARTIYTIEVVTHADRLKVEGEGAAAAGFGSVDVMRRAFVRLLGITPRRYRDFAGHSSSGC